MVENEERPKASRNLVRWCCFESAVVIRDSEPSGHFVADKAAIPCSVLTAKVSLPRSLHKLKQSLTNGAETAGPVTETRKASQ